jgi:hypothetical protein
MPGRGDKLNDFIGSSIADMGFEVYGREILSNFAQLHFPQQLQIIKNDIKTLFWCEELNLIGDSYGGYLLLHALAELAAFPGRILLLSPVLGQAIDKQNLFMSRPPRAKKLLQLVKTQKFPVPKYLEIHTGAEDKGCDPILAKKISSLLTNSKIFIIKGEGHRLNKTYINGVIRKFIFHAYEPKVHPYAQEIYHLHDLENNELKSYVLPEMPNHPKESHLD